MNASTKSEGAPAPWLFIIGLLLGGAFLVYMVWDSMGGMRLFRTSAVVELTAENWEREVVQSDVPVLVDFWAPWCGPCRAIAPTIDKIAVSYKGKVKVAKLNIDDADRIADAYGIDSIPRVLIFNGGEKPVQTIQGRDLLSEAVIAAALDKVLAKK